MNLTTDTIPFRPNGRGDVLRRIGLAVLGATLLAAAACGSDSSDSGATASTAPVTSRTSAPTVGSTTTALAATTAPTTSATVAPRPTATFDERVDVDGVRLHVRCTGSGDATVLLIAGYESGDDIWAKVEPEIGGDARVCAYARPGTGSSDPALWTQTFTTQADVLHRLLTEIDEPGPFVVVGHSFGGAEAVTFASMFADEVTGVVLVDASPATWPSDLCAVADDGSQDATSVRSLCAGWADPTTNVEHLDVFTAFGEVAGIDSLGSLPMTVITAVDRPFSDLGAAELTRLTEAWNTGQQRWSELSTDSQVVPVEATGHHIELDRPDVVIDAISRHLP